MEETMTEILNEAILHKETLSMPVDLLSYDSTAVAPYSLGQFGIHNTRGQQEFGYQPFAKRTFIKSNKFSSRASISDKNTKPFEDMLLFSRYKNETLDLVLDKTKNYLIVCAGKVTSNITDTTCEFGRVIFINAGSNLDQISFTGDFSVLEIGENFQYSTQVPGNFASQTAQKSDFITFSSKCLAELCKSLWDYDLKESAEARNLIISLAMIGITEAQRCNINSDTSSYSRLPKWKLKKLEKYVQENISRRLSNEELAVECGYSPSYFCRMLKTSLGQTPHQYVLKKRLEYACELLRTSDTPICAIAYDCGFSSQSHMTKIFGTLIGETPRSYRASMDNSHKDNLVLVAA